MADASCTCTERPPRHAGDVERIPNPTCPVHLLASAPQTVRVRVRVRVLVRIDSEGEWAVEGMSGLTDVQIRRRLMEGWEFYHDRTEREAWVEVDIPLPPKPGPTPTYRGALTEAPDA